MPVLPSPCRSWFLPLLLAALVVLPGVPVAAAAGGAGHRVAACSLVVGDGHVLVAPSRPWSVCAAPAASASAGNVSTLAAAPNAGRTQVLGFLAWTNLPLYTSLRYDLLTTVAYFTFFMLSSGHIDTSSSGYGAWQGTTAHDMVTLAHRHHDRVVVTIGCFDAATIAGIVGSPQATRNTIDDVVAQIRGRADGVNVDFEYFGASATVRANFTTFMSKLTAAVHAAAPGSSVTVDTYPSSATGQTIFDVTALSSIVDGLFVMGYDFHWSGAPTAGAVAPMYGDYYDVYLTVQDYLKIVPANKILLGVPYYGYAWPTVSGAPNAATTGAGRAYTYAQIASGGIPTSTLHWDPVAEVPWRSWQDTTGHWWELYYENPRSLGYKYDLVKSSGLLGTGMWALGYDAGTPALWNELAARVGPHGTYIGATLVSASYDPPYGSTVQAGQPLTVTWTLRNTGNVRWTRAFTLKNTGGTAMTTTTSIPFAGVSPGAAIAVTLHLHAPATPGSYSGQWQTVDHTGGIFGPVMSEAITVKG